MFIRNKYVIIIIIALLAGIYLLFPSVKSHNTTTRESSNAEVTDVNVILISIDTLRADRLGAYGYSKARTPIIDAFSKDAILFKNAIAHAPSTAPSHGSIFTSLNPSLHKAFVTRKSPLTLEYPTIAEILKQSGYSTVSFNGGAQLDKAFGFARGFDIYKSYADKDYSKEFMIDRANEAINWIKENSKQKFFLFLHTYEVHHPYTPDEKFHSEEVRNYKGNFPKSVEAKLLRSINQNRRKASLDDRSFISSLYDSEVTSVDAALGSFFEFLKGHSLYDKSLIVITSDHGEEFGEHGSIGWHSHTLYDELLKVPLIIKLPDSQFSSTQIEDQVRGIDILPTVLAVTGQKALPHFQGRSLLPLIDGSLKGEFDPYAISQRDTKRLKIPTSIRTNKWKLIGVRLYDLVKDANEKIDVAQANSAIVSNLQSKLDEKLGSFADQDKNSMEIDNQTLEQLKTLGYIE